MRERSYLSSPCGIASLIVLRRPDREEGAMPDTTINIDRDQRGGLYELIRNHLGSIEDFWVALERTKDYAEAERLGLEFAEDFRLLRDIGWSEHDVRRGIRPDDAGAGVGGPA
jgi:hypothetical protein